MSKELYVEALADAKKLKEIAEDNAKRALVEAVTPRIKDLIERELLSESSDEDKKKSPEGVDRKGKQLITQDDKKKDERGENDVLDELDLDEEDDKDPLAEETYSLDEGSIDALATLFKKRSNKVNSAVELESSLYRLSESLNSVRGAGRLVRETRGYKDKIDEMISIVDNMYDYVQESVMDASQKSKYELKLESIFQELKGLQEQKMRTRRNALDEATVGFQFEVPDEVEDEVMKALRGGIEVMGGEGGDEGEEGEESDEDMGDELGDLGGEEESDEDKGDEGEEEESDEDLEGLLGGEDEESEDDDDDDDMEESAVVEIDEGMLRREIGRMKMLRESRESGDVIVEIDEGMLRREIGRMKMLREMKKEEDPKAHEEGDMHEDSDDKLSEDDLLELVMSDDDANEGHSHLSAHSGAEYAQPNDQDRDVAESLKRVYAGEKRLQGSIAARLRQVQLESARARSRGDRNRSLALSRQAAGLRNRLSESLSKTAKISRALTESGSRHGHRLNGGPNRPAERLAESNLRNKLAETNLFNAKLVYTNKLLQNDSLSKRQKASAANQRRSTGQSALLPEAPRPTRRKPAGNSRPLSESVDRRIIGSSSRPTRPASTSLNEGVETDRWAKLAGIMK